jgi:phosphate transport system substrate-binding protein
MPPLDGRLVRQGTRSEHDLAVGGSNLWRNHRVMIGTKRTGALAIAAAFALGACGGSGGATTAPTTQPSVAAPGSGGGTNPSAGAGGSIACADGKITALGSTALQPVVDAAAKQFVAACPGATVDVQGGGSGTGLTQVLQGGADIGNSDVTAESKLKPDEASTLVDHIVARQGWLMVANKDVTGVTSLTSQQATDIWTGKVTNWKDVGGPDVPIILVLRPESSGTRAVFKAKVLGGAAEATGQALTEDSNGAVAQAVAQTSGATSVLAFAYYQANKGELVGIGLDGIDASIDNLTNGTYKLQDAGHMYTKGEADGLKKAFLDFMMTDQVQMTLLPSLGYAPAGS